MVFIVAYSRWGYVGKKNKMGYPHLSDSYVGKSRLAYMQMWSNQYIYVPPSHPFGKLTCPNNQFYRIRKWSHWREWLLVSIMANAERTTGWWGSIPCSSIFCLLHITTYITLYLEALRSKTSLYILHNGRTVTYHVGNLQAVNATCFRGPSHSAACTSPPLYILFYPLAYCTNCYMTNY